MLNISEHSVSPFLPENFHAQIKDEALPQGHRMFRTWLLSLIVLGVLFMFLPWQQNIRADGTITPIDPSQRPQDVNATIGGRIEKWFVREGDFVEAGDTILYLSEIKTEYFDPDLVDRTGEQVLAKGSAILAYAGKASALSEQIAALRAELKVKREQLARKAEQTQLKLNSARADYEQALIARDIAKLQLDRTDTLFQRDIKSRTELEDKRNKYQETFAKVVSTENKVGEAEAELALVLLQIDNLSNEYANKIAKAESDRFTALSNQATAEGERTAKEIDRDNYARRQSFYYITAPRSGYITKALKTGIGEIVKESEAVVTIVSTDYQLAVEMYVRPMDLPLVHLGSPVNFIFDGWPAIVFSGWPGLTFGSYQGTVVAIDNNISSNGNFRILVSPDPNSERSWPEALRPGGGAQGLAMLNTVPLWYELWRQLNGFPPDYYAPSDGKAEKEPKFKAPITRVK